VCVRVTCVLMKLCWDPLKHTQTHTLSTYKTRIPVSDLCVNDLRVDTLSLSLFLSHTHTHTHRERERELMPFTHLLRLPWAVRGKSRCMFMFTQKCRYSCSLLQVSELFAYKHFFSIETGSVGGIYWRSHLIFNGTAMKRNFRIGVTN